MTANEYEILISKVARKMACDSRLITSGKIKYGKNNKWEGSSLFQHQIDVSLENERTILLIECKCWYRKYVSPEAFLTIWSRVKDISDGTSAAGRTVRGALVTTGRFNRGVYTLANHIKKI